MAKLTGSYEAIIVVSIKNGEEQAKSLVEKFSNLISENGTLENVNEWGKRRLAYPINYEADAYYAVYTFTSKPEFPTELNRVMGITEGVLRSIIVSK
jgi:small subunit ribosomal protein S6